MTTTPTIQTGDVYRSSIIVIMNTGLVQEAPPPTATPTPAPPRALGRLLLAVVLAVAVGTAAGLLLQSPQTGVDLGLAVFGLASPR